MTSIMVLRNDTTLFPACKFLVLLSVLVTCFIRPFALGLWFSFAGFAILFIISFLLQCWVRHDNYKVTSKFIFVLLFGYFMEFLLYQTDVMYKSFFTLIGQVIIIFMLFSNKAVMSLFFTYFKRVFFLLCILGICNFVLECFYDIEKLQIMTLDSHNQGFEYIYYLSYPLSLSYMSWYIPESNLPLLRSLCGQHVRQNFFFIEPGIAAIIIVLMIHYLLSLPNESHKKIKITILMISLFLTFSTTGPIIFFLSLFFRYLASNRNHLSIKTVIASVILAFMAYYAYLYMPIFGKIDKMNYGNAAESLEKHSNVQTYVIGGTILLAVIGLYISKFKENVTLYLTILGILCVGYLSNHVAYTNLATMFLFYDNNNEKYYKRKILATM